MIVLEVAIESVEDARVAVASGADRLELCAELAVGGLTPDRSLYEQIRSEVTVPIVVMLRPRAGDFVWTDAERHEILTRQADFAALPAPPTGYVTGMLTPEHSIDLAFARQMREQVTRGELVFHRAFDAIPDRNVGLEELILLGYDRILTSGGRPTAFQGIRDLAELTGRAGQRITILPGGGIKSGNVREILTCTQAGQVHGAFRTPAGRTDAAEVQRVRQVLETFS